VISLSRLGSMLYLGHLMPAGAYRVGRTRRPHFLFSHELILDPIRSVVRRKRRCWFAETTDYHLGNGIACLRTEFILALYAACTI